MTKPEGKPILLSDFLLLFIPVGTSRWGEKKIFRMVRCAYNFFFFRRRKEKNDQQMQCKFVTVWRKMLLKLGSCKFSVTSMDLAQAEVWKWDKKKMLLWLAFWLKRSEILYKVMRSPSPEMFKSMPFGGNAVERTQTLESGSRGWPLKTFLGLRIYDSLRSAERRKKVMWGNVSNSIGIFLIYLWPK